MTNVIIKKYAFTRNQFFEWQSFMITHPWAKQYNNDTNLPENCVSIYYSVDLETQIVKERLCMVSYSAKYKPDFKRISVAWVAEYFAIEPADLLQLDQPEKNIIQPGGEIFCLLNGEDVVVGTVAAIVEHEGVGELGKMGVLKEYCGKGYAHPLMNEAISWAKNKSFTHMNLYTAARLLVAVSLYEKYGFRAVPLDENIHFDRVDLAMRLVF